MKLQDRWSSLFFIVFSVLLCFQSYKLNIGSYHSPGPGFLPFWVGLIVGILSLILLVKSIMKDGEEYEKDISGGKRWKNILLVLFSLLAYTIVLEKLGFVFSTFFFIAFLLKVIESKRWSVVAIVAIAAALGTYLVFEVWLQTQLPKGILG